MANRQFTFENKITQVGSSNRSEVAFELFLRLFGCYGAYWGEEAFIVFTHPREYVAS